MYLLQLTRTGNNLTGTLQEATDASTGTSVVGSSSQVNGTVSGEDVTLNFGTVTLSGTVEPSGLSLTAPQGDGSVSSLAFQAGSVNLYNSETARLRANANAVAAQRSADAAATAEAQAQASAAAATAQQDVLDKEQSTCTAAGGTWGVSIAGGCSIQYVSASDGRTYNYSVAFDADGNVVPVACEDSGFSATHDCDNTAETAAQAQQDCADGSYNYGSVGTWHADTDICSL